MSENTHNNERILDETGGDILFADLFIQNAQERALETERYVPQTIINAFYKEVERCKKEWKKRQNY